MELIRYNIREMDKIKKIWGQLGPFIDSYFLTWGWVKNWLDHLPPSLRPDLFVIMKDGQIKGAFFAGLRYSLKNFIIPSKTLNLNTLGKGKYDTSLWIAYNSFVMNDFGSCNFKELLEKLPPDWDEFVMPCLDMTKFPADQINKVPLEKYNCIVKEAPAYHVDLNLLRDNNCDYYKILKSKKRRYNLKRSYKYLENKVNLSVADNPQTARDYFNEMLVLHQKSFKLKKTKSTFDNRYSRQFHHSLIENRFGHGEIQLVKVTSKEKTLGVIYNLIHKKKVFSYQSGFIHSNDNNFRPGLICHVEAAKYNAGNGNDTYNFLAGNDRYKNNLSTGSDRVSWSKIQKKKLRFQFEAMVKSLLM